MKFPVAIEPGHVTQAWGVVVPDLPGCFSASDMGFDEAIACDHLRAQLECLPRLHQPICPLRHLAQRRHGQARGAHRNRCP